MVKRKFRDLDVADLLPVRLEELISENVGRVRDYSFEDVKKLAQELKKQQIELEFQKSELDRTRQELNQTIRSRTFELVQTSEELINELLDHKKTLSLLKESEEFSNDLLNKASHPIVVSNADNSIRYVNPAFEKLTGFSLTDVRGKTPPFPYWPVEKQQEYYEKYLDKNVSQGELLFNRKNGEAFWAKLVSTPVEENGVVKYRICAWLDITERKRAKERMEGIAREWQMTFDSIQDMVSIHDTEFRLVRVNKAFEDAVGKKQEELIGKKCYEIVHGLSSPENNCPHLQTLQTRRSTSMEIFEPRIGQYLEVSTSPIIGENGEVAGTIHIAKNISDRKKVEEALLRSEEHFRQLIRYSPVPLSVASDREEIEFLNDRFTATFGYQREDVPNLDVWLEKFFPDEKYRQEIASGMRISTQKSFVTGDADNSPEVQMTCKDGSVRIVETSGTWIGNKHLVVFNDVTERKKAEEALRASHEFNNALLENTPDQIIVFNPDTSIRYVNPAFVKKNGWTPQEMIGVKSPYPWWPDEEKEKLAIQFKQAMQSDKGHGEIICRKKNGERYWRSFSYVSVKSGGKQKYMLATGSDITEQKLAEKELRESERHFRVLTGKFPVPMIVNNDKSEIEYVNEEFTAVFGYTMKDFRNRGDWLKLAYPDEKYRNEVISSWEAAKEKAAREDRSPEPQEYRVTAKDGTVRNVEISATVVGNKRVMVLNDITERRKAEEEMKQGMESVQRALQGAIDAAAKMVELRDPYTAGHQKKVARLAMAIAQEMNLSEEQIKYLGMAATVHDIGKINVPAEILSRTGKLTDLEFQMMRMHVQGSYDILKNIEFPWPVAEVVLQHHERMDGSGYPGGLKGNEIMLEARILALADTVEAMSAHRPYRPALGVGEALEEISKNKGRLYDTDVVEACINLILGKGFRLDKE